MCNFFALLFCNSFKTHGFGSEGLVKRSNYICFENIRPESSFFKMRSNKVIDLFVGFRSFAPVNACTVMMDSMKTVIEQKKVSHRTYKISRMIII